MLCCVFIYIFICKLPSLYETLCFLSSDIPIKEKQVCRHAARMLEVLSDTQITAGVYSHMQAALLSWVHAVSHVWGFDRGELVKKLIQS